jgi:hypothetical protein
MITQVEIDEAIAEAAKQAKELHTAAVNVERAKKNFELAKARAISKGVEGKNAEERKANLEISVKPLTNTLNEMESNYKKARLDHEIAYLELTRVKLTIRRLEILKNG